MKRIVLTDGGMGQELLRRSGAAPTPLWSARVLIDEPDLVRDLHVDFIEAGARVITINTYAATQERLQREGIGDLFQKLQRRGIDLAREARDMTRADVRIAGCLPPLFGSYKPELTLSFDDTLAIYRAIVAEQQDHVDLMLCETMASAHEALAAATAASESGLPIWVSWTLDDRLDAICLRSGETIADAAKTIAHIGTEARLINCSKPEVISAAMDDLVALSGPVGAYANGFTSVGALQHGGTVDVLEARRDLGPESYADFAEGWAGKGAAIVGGCCEVGPEHIAALRNRLLNDGFELTGTPQ
ncbi:MAG: homocysteine S-methyltransferase family protein [Rhizobiaceae bacterium]